MPPESFVDTLAADQIEKKMGVTAGAGRMNLGEPLLSLEVDLAFVTAGVERESLLGLAAGCIISRLTRWDEPEVHRAEPTEVGRNRFFSYLDAFLHGIEGGWALTADLEEQGVGLTMRVTVKRNGVE